jgi:hypothetical protein
VFADAVSTRWSGGLRMAAAGVLALAVAAAAGWWLGGAFRSPQPVSVADSTAGVESFQLRLSPDWTPAPAAPGPEVKGGRSFAPTAGLPARALLVIGPAADPSLVPAALRAELPERLDAPRRTKVAGLAAWTYPPVRDDKRVLQVTVVPTTRGVLAVACSAPPSTWSVALGCASGIRQAVPADGRALVPSADLAFRLRATDVLRELDVERVRGRKALVAAKRPAARTAASARLAGLHGDAASALAPFAVAGATGGTVAALRGAARSYGALARAAGSESRPRFVRARAAVRRADGALARAVGRLRAA